MFCTSGLQFAGLRVNIDLRQNPRRLLFEICKQHCDFISTHPRFLLLWSTDGASDGYIFSLDTFDPCFKILKLHYRISEFDFFLALRTLKPGLKSFYIWILVIWIHLNRISRGFKRDRLKTGWFLMQRIDLRIATVN